MNTSSFSISALHGLSNTVAISTSVPISYTGRRYPDLAPDRAALTRYKINRDVTAFTKAYNAKLAKMDPRKVFAELGSDSTLLCYEDKGAFCHRLLVAQWFSLKLGITVSEFNPPRIQDLSRGLKTADVIAWDNAWKV